MKDLFYFFLKKACFFFWAKIKPSINDFQSEFYTRKVISLAKSVGQGVRINGAISLQYPNGLILGGNVHIGANCHLNCAGGIVIGDNTHISRNVTIYSANHDYEGRSLPYDDNLLLKPVVIEKNVWIGMNVSISPGTTIGEGTIIGMGATVSGDILPMSIIGNQPTRLLKERDENHYNGLDSNQIYGGVNGKKVNKLDSSIKSLDVKKVFVLSTGRAGSNAIAQVLDQNPEIVSKHESFPYLIQSANDELYGNKNSSISFIKSALTYQELPKSTKLYCESDQKIVPFIDSLNNFIPNAKFIWLIRSPIDFVKSSYYRGWFSDEEFFLSSDRSTPMVYSAKQFSRNRVNGFLTGDFSKKEWEAMHPFERNCWYWYYWNKLIENQLLKIDKEKWIVVDLNHLEVKMEEIRRFTETTDFEYEVKSTNEAKYKTIESNNWSELWVIYIDKWCTPYYNELKKVYNL